MIPNTVYTLMKNSVVTDPLGNAYPDVCTFPIQSFVQTTSPFYRYLSTFEIERFDITCYYYYGTSDYTDIVLWLNNKSHRDELSTTEKTSFPDKKDLQAFYLKWKKGL